MRLNHNSKNSIRIWKKSENKFKNKSDDIGKCRIKSENQIEKPTIEIKKFDAQNSEN